MTLSEAGGAHRLLADGPTYLTIILSHSTVPSYMSALMRITHAFVYPTMFDLSGCFAFVPVSKPRLPFVLCNNKSHGQVVVAREAIAAKSKLALLAATCLCHSLRQECVAVNVSSLSSPV